MKLPHQLLLKLSPLAEATRGRPLVEPVLELTEEGESRIVIDSSHGHFEFDIARRVVRRDGVDIAVFDAIQSVDIGGFPGGRGEKSWSLSLYMGFFNRITLGRTYDDGDASVIAARLAKAIGCKVVSLALRR
jgi:hypothetical protein